MRRWGAVVALTGSALALLASGCIGTELGRTGVPGDLAWVANGTNAYGLAMDHPSDNDLVRDALLDALTCEVTDRERTYAIADSFRSVITTVNNVTRWYEFVPPEGQVSVSCQFTATTSAAQRWVDEEGPNASLVVLQSDE